MTQATSTILAPAGGYPATQNIGGTNYTFQGNTERLDTVQTGSGASAVTWNVNPGFRPDRFVMRRSGTTNPGRNVVWEARTVAGTATGLEGQSLTSTLTEEDVLSQNNLLLGTDNLFINSGNGSGNMTNIERVDFLYNSTFAVTVGRGFVVIERGVNGDHDGFGIAAILAVDAGGNPSQYGTLVGVAPQWSSSLRPRGTSIFNRDGATWNSTGGNNNQTLGGILIPLTDLAPLGSMIYGYSLFGYDVVTGGISNLVNFAAFPSTPDGSVNGIDLVAANVGYVSNDPFDNVPEPGTLWLAGAALFALSSLKRR